MNTDPGPSFQILEKPRKNLPVSICDIPVKQKILVIKETKREEISLKPKFWTKKKFIQYRELLLNSATKFAQLLSTFNGINESYQNSANIRQY